MHPLTVCVHCLRRPEEGVQYSGTTVTDQLNQGSLLLTADLFFQPLPFQDVCRLLTVICLV